MQTPKSNSIIKKKGKKHQFNANWITWERGSSSELGKSYWLRSLRLKIEGPECWGADSGGILGFFSYFRFVRIASVFSGCEWGRTNKRHVYTAVCIQHAFQQAKLRLCYDSELCGGSVCVTTVHRKHWYADGGACQMATTPSSSIQPVPLLTPPSPVCWPLPAWTDSNSTGISQILFRR